MNTSTVNSPVAIAWRTFNRLVRNGVMPERKRAIAAAIKAGVAPGTAAVQFNHWRKEAMAAAAA